MKTLIVFFIGYFFFMSTADAQFGKLLDQAKSSAQALKDIGSGQQIDIAGGLKEALEEGVGSAVERLAAEKGYLDSPYKILVPEEASKVISTLSKVPGFQDVEQKMVAKMNEAAELAVKSATPIFVSAIKQMSFRDAQQILMGEEDAATRYLDKQANRKLYSDFSPVIESALMEVRATEYWTTVAKKYNKIPLTKDVNTDLTDHVTKKAIYGLFELIAKKEVLIREDVSQRTSPLLQEVFAKQDQRRD